MNINLLPFAVLWMFLAVVVVGLIFYRMWIAKDEDDTLHVMEGDDGRVAQQAVMAEKLETIDHWGQTLTVIALVFGLAMGSVYLYQTWAVSERLLQ
jgi:uncharacterized membrane protein